METASPTQPLGSWEPNVARVRHSSSKDNLLLLAEASRVEARPPPVEVEPPHYPAGSVGELLARAFRFPPPAARIMTASVLALYGAVRLLFAFAGPPAPPL